ncbi:MAG TPA: DUF1499 domain-containing protein [Thermoanaerobaculia bacterium]|nr:DUF1499 domain-containing protein [Thermoanaerobaculia bacterium]
MRRLLRELLRRGRRERRPPGVEDGTLARCPRSPCCVSSQAGDPAKRLDPLPLTGTAAEARQRLLAVLASWPRTRLARDDGSYLHAECSTPLLGFVDDLELLLDEAAGAIQVRSVSRIGNYDFGTNRRRVERLRRDLTAAGDSAATS